MKKIQEVFSALAEKLHMTKKQLLIIASIVGLLLAGVLIFFLFFRYDRIPKDALVIMDANDKSSIQEAGFTAVRGDTYKTKFAAKWTVDDVADFQFKSSPVDISQHDTMEFRIKLDSADDARIMFYFGSENETTEEEDYYSYTISLPAGEWKEFSIDISRLATYGTPLGLDQLTEFSIRTTGWRNTVEEGSTIRLGHMYLTGEPVTLKRFQLSDGAGEYPHFTQTAINEAAELAVKPTGWPRYEQGAGLELSLNDHSAEACTNALYYLTLAVRYNELDSEADPLYASNGMLCKDAVIQLLEFFLQGGNEPAASVGCWWGHGVMSNSLLLIKNTDSIYSELSQDTKDRMDWMMKALAIAGNWGYNDANDYETGFDLSGNFDKTWNMNFQNSYLSVILNASLYFGNDELDRIFVEFDYDTYMDKFREYKFINVIYTWETAGKTLMETGVTVHGEVPVLENSYGLSGDSIGDAAGSGKGVKIPFQYTAVLPNGTKEVLTLKDEDFAYRLFNYLISQTYLHEVESTHGTEGSEDYCYILGDITGTTIDKETGEEVHTYSTRTSPFEGRIGMFSELKSTDSKGFRSSLVYAFDSFEILIGLYTNMTLFEEWDSTLQDVQALEELIYVGNEDFFYRMEYGYQAYCNGEADIMSEGTVKRRGLLFIKDIWKNVHCGWDANVTLRTDSVSVEIIDLPDAEPVGGITQAPVGALAAFELYNSKFVEESYTSIGKLTKGTVSFDMVVGDGMDLETYDAVVAIMSKGENQTWNNMEMSLQLQKQLVNIRSGSSYANTGFRFESNYRFRVEFTFDASTRTYSAKIRQIYPTEGELYECKDIPFRAGSDMLGYVDAIAVLSSEKNSELWLENVYVNGKLIQETNINYDSGNVAVASKDEVPPVTLIRVHKDIWDEFTDFSKAGNIYYAKKETVVITSHDAVSDLKELNYYVSTSALSESAMRSLNGWKSVEDGLTCFKLEPYKKTYVYAKAVDSEGNVSYVSSCMILDPDAPSVSGFLNGRVYCDAGSMTIKDKYLSSVTVNGEEVIKQLTSNGTYYFAKNSGTHHIVATDYAGNVTKKKVRFSDTTMTNKSIIDSNRADSITTVGWTIEEDDTFNGGLYSAKWKVSSPYKNFKGISGDLSDYDTLKFSIKIVPNNKATDSTFYVFFGSPRDANGKLRYFGQELSAKANKWQEYQIELSDLTATRQASWDDIEYLRIQANSWGDKANIDVGYTIYIGYMELIPKDEQRVHATNHGYEWAPSKTDTTKHDYKYTCCDTAVKSETHIKSADSDLCSVCGQDMNLKVMLSNGEHLWENLYADDGKICYTKIKKVAVTVEDYGFGIAKLEYAESSSYVDNDGLASLQWKNIANGGTLTLDEGEDARYFYARATDKNGKVTYASAQPMIYDVTAPKIIGVESGMTYCDAPTITVQEKHLSKVSVDGGIVNLQDGTYTFEENCGTQTVSATDKAGNTTTIFVTVSDDVKGDYVVSKNLNWKVDASQKDMYLVDSSSTTGKDIASYKTLTFKMKVTPSEKGTCTKMGLQVSLWSHTYYEWLIDVTPNKWQTVTIDLHNPDVVSGNMMLTNVRKLTLCTAGGQTDIKTGSKIEINNVVLKESRIHGAEHGFTYVSGTTDSGKHHKTYSCCNTIVATEAHQLGQDGACIKCTTPTITGVENHMVYCSGPEMTVSDNTLLKSVKVNGEEVVLDSNGVVQIPDVNGVYIIEAIDEYNCKTTKEIEVLDEKLGETYVLETGFTQDFTKTKRVSRTTENFGALLDSYQNMTFTIKVTSETLSAGTDVDAYISLRVDGNNFYTYHQCVKVGQENALSFRLDDYKSVKGNPGSIRNMNDITFYGEYSTSQMKVCTVEVSDITLSGLKKTQQHVWKNVVDEEYRVNSDEIANCEHGISYYKTCVCGEKSSDTFMSSKDSTVHASMEYTYVQNQDNHKQHHKVYSCCGAVVATEAHYKAGVTEAGTYICDSCGEEYEDYLDYDAPVISNIENGKTYYYVDTDMPTMLVQDKWLDSVTVNGTSLEIDTEAELQSASYTFMASKKPYKIIATDHQGNQTTCEIYVAKSLFKTDFQSTTINKTKNTLEAEGWSGNSDCRHGTLNGTTYGVANCYLAIPEVDGSKVLSLKGSKSGAVDARVWKSLDISGLDNLTVEFDVKILADIPIKVGSLTDMNTTDVEVSPLYWQGGNSSSWTSVKLEFAIDGDVATVSAYTRSDDGWVADMTYQNVSLEILEQKINLSFLADEVKESQAIYLDNIIVYTF